MFGVKQSLIVDFKKGVEFKCYASRRLPSRARQPSAQAVPFRLNAFGAASLLCQVPWNPMSRLAPGAMVASYGRLRAVTAAPDWL